MSRWLVGMSGNKDAMIRHLEKCEKRKIEQFAEILIHANKLKEEIAKDDYSKRNYTDSLQVIIDLCNVFVDKRSDKQKMQDQIDEMQKKIEGMEGDSECGCC